MSESKSSEIQIYHLKSGARRYQVEIEHSRLNQHKVVRGDDPDIVRRKADAQMAKWDEMWAVRLEKEKRAAAIAHGKETASKRTEEAEQMLQALDSVLADTLSINDEVDWESLKNTSPYPKAKPSFPNTPLEPKPTDDKYQVTLSLMDRIRSSKRIEKEQAAKDAFENDYKNWESEKEKLERVFAEKTKKWEADNIAYLKARDASNVAIEQQKQEYLAGEDPQAILDYCDLVLSDSQYPDFFPQNYELDYNPESKLLLIDYQLPPIDIIPTLKTVRYVQSRDEYIEKHISDAELRKVYDNLLYQMALRTIHELFEADAINAIERIVFNGYVDGLDLATGQRNNTCVLSISVNKDTFEQINLRNIEPKACFKQLKGVSAARLYSLTPVAPLMKIDREDSRFVSSYDIADAIEGENLAAMNWEDFEHLIRELFEKEFASAGGEVKVTRASRDGGIDAVAFDPDPIRGGKIVIQAKRYTNTVGVSAVRDLYGTLINEGATKGILATTADYGPDAHEFALGKPIVLLNGAQLLYLLEKHGHKARIDIREAKQILADNN